MVDLDEMQLQKKEPEPISNTNVSNRLRKKFLLFQILSEDAFVSITELQRKALVHKIVLSRSSAYRIIADFEKNKSIEQSEVRHLRTISEILKALPEGEKISAQQLHEKALASDSKFHRSTTYRILSRLASIELIEMTRVGRLNLYQWKSKQES